MTDPTARKDICKDIWPVILAAGNEEENQPIVRRFLFRQKPRQYYSLAGNKSIFQQTLDRAELLSAPECRVTVIARQHYLKTLQQVGIHRPGKLVAEPFDQGTAAEVFLGLAHVCTNNPQATVLLLPCDHIVYPEDEFVRAAQAGIRAVELLNDHLVLLAVASDGMVPFYGSIEPGREYGWIANYHVRSVEAFSGRPDSNKSGTLNNTSILVAKAETLWKMGCDCVPEIMRPLERYRAAIGTDLERAVLEEVYERMPSRNFFAHVLQSSPERVAVIETSGVQWCDWSELRRMAATVHEIEEESVHEIEEESSRSVA